MVITNCLTTVASAPLDSSNLTSIRHLKGTFGSSRTSGLSELKANHIPCAGFTVFKAADSQNHDKCTTDDCTVFLNLSKAANSESLSHPRRTTHTLKHRAHISPLPVWATPSRLLLHNSKSYKTQIIQFRMILNILKTKSCHWFSMQNSVKGLKYFL